LVSVIHGMSILLNDMRRVNLDEKELRRLYLEKKLSYPKIAEKMNTTARIVQKNIVRYKIPKWTRAESSKQSWVRDRKPRDYSEYRGENHHLWKGGRRIHERGYVMVYRPDHPRSYSNGYIMEHRIVMEQHLGRLLNDEEVVHHKNGNKEDNRIENLILFATTADHTIHHQGGA